MVATFVGKTGHVETIELEDRRTVTAEWYTTVCLPQVIAQLRKSYSKRRIILHHDNASSHSTRQAIEYLKKEKVEILDHPPRFQSGEEAVDAFKSAILNTPTLECNKCYSNWFERMEKCIKLQGEYFEKQ